MDYEQKYNEALEKAKKLRNGFEGYNANVAIIEQIFPELRESEDERIRKAIIHYILYETKGNISEATEHVWVTWLEKQKEPTIGAKSERVIKAARRVLNNWLYGDVSADVSGDLTELEYAIREYDGEEKQKEQESAECMADSIKFDEGFKTGREVGFREGVESVKPAEWSEDEDQLIGFIFDLLNDLEWSKDYAMSKKECLERLNSLRPSWKPSEEQIKVLSWAANGMVDKSIAAPEMRAVLRELYEQLKKL